MVSCFDATSAVVLVFAPGIRSLLCVMVECWSDLVPAMLLHEYVSSIEGGLCRIRRKFCSGLFRNDAGIYLYFIVV